MLYQYNYTFFIMKLRFCNKNLKCEAIEGVGFDCRPERKIKASTGKFPSLIQVSSLMSKNNHRFKA